MDFDDIPEDREPAYLCDCGGTITLTDYNDTETVWECNSCDFKKVVKKIEQGNKWKTNMNKGDFNIEFNKLWANPWEFALRQDICEFTTK